MTGKINIGKNNEENIYLDLPSLIDTRLLIQANSGGGKSYALRRLLEQSHGKLQQIVLDMEGEFNTLREKHDYILVGKEGDIPASVKTAELLARKLLELNTSAIIDLYELKAHERILFVKRFLDSMVNAPKELWHPVFVVVDEAHVFCPEKGKAESMGAVIDLCTRGRKRGYCAVLATQRLSKLHKDAAAECNNKLIGRAQLDIDMKRAGDELGFTKKDDLFSLRTLEAGEFYSFGPSFPLGINKFKVDEVNTTHPKAGSRKLTSKAPPATSKVQAILSKLNDLPKEAEQEINTLQDYKKKVRELKAELRKKPKPEVDEKRLAQTYQKGLKDGEMQSRGALRQTEKQLQQFKKKLEGIARIVEVPVNVEKIQKSPMFNRSSLPATPKAPPVSSNVAIDEQEKESILGKCERTILAFLAENSERSFSKAQIGAITGYSMKSGGFNNALYSLSSKGFIQRNGDIRVTQEGMDVQTDIQVGELSVDLWLRKLPKCPREILKVLLDNPDEEYSKEDIGEKTGYSSTSGGFNNALYKLNTLELLRRENGVMRLNPEILELM